MTAPDLRTEIDVVVIGGGQAGLAISHELTKAGVEHVVLEKEKVANSWEQLWDDFYLNTPSWSATLPGFPYEGEHSESFMSRAEVVNRLRQYARSFAAPVLEGVEVRQLEPTDRGFRLLAADRIVRARAVVVCTGAYQRSFLPGSGPLPTHVAALNVRSYRHPKALPDGAALVIGGGQSGFQIAEELCEAGVETIVSCGKAAWAPRRIGGRDLLWWALEIGFLDDSVEGLPSPEARLRANLTASGNNGGHDLHARVLRARGATLVGRYLGSDGAVFRFGADLGESVAWGDARYREFADEILAMCRERGLDEPDLPDPEPFDESAPTEIEASQVGSVIYAGGFRPDYGWISVAGAFDGMGFPIQEDGRSAAHPGLFFSGVHFLRTRKSALLLGTVADAPIVTGGIESYLGRVRPGSASRR
jgi:putative flavoprotein involved in K+ transport